jgi:hypothetical protein
MEPGYPTGSKANEVMSRGGENWVRKVSGHVPDDYGPWRHPIDAIIPSTHPLCTLNYSEDIA